MQDRSCLSFMVVVFCLFLFSNVGYSFLHKCTDVNGPNNSHYQAHIHTHTHGKSRCSNLISDICMNNLRFHKSDVYAAVRIFHVFITHS